jgi:hypothetical protein
MSFFPQSGVEIGTVVFHPVDSYFPFMYVRDHDQLFRLEQNLVSGEVSHPPAVEAIDGVAVLNGFSLFQIQKVLVSIEDLGLGQFGGLLSP